MKVLIPFRGLKNGKSRLRQHIPDEIVNKKILELLINTVSAVRANKLEPIIISSERKILPNIEEIIDTGEDLNKAIQLAIQQYKDDKFMIVMPDLPGLNEESVSRALLISKRSGYLVSQTYDTGTAIAILPRKILIENVLGPKSAEKIIEVADLLKIGVTQAIQNELQRDLDTIEDWKHWEFPEYKK